MIVTKTQAEIARLKKKLEEIKQKQPVQSLSQKYSIVALPDGKE